MMMRKMNVMLLLVAALMASGALARPVTAQQPGDWMWNLQYSTVLGAGDTKDFADGFSWRGVTVDAQRVLRPGLSVGISTGWHVLNEETSGTLVLDQGSITGTAFRSVNSFPILATADYSFGGSGALQPFVGAGVGTYWIQNRTEAGVFAIDDDNWHFGLMGEAGLALRQGRGSAFTLSARYNYGFEANGIERPYWTFSAGYRISG
ncbi:MAG: outer membrane beta-barrel protein [Gemmatimonadota bacterium]|jgi:outer membrane protein W